MDISIISLYTFLAGILIASGITALGLGGGIIWAPFLLLVYGLPVKQIVGTSLIIQVFGLGSATVKYSRLNVIDWRLSIKIVFLGMPGIFLGIYLLNIIHPTLFDFALGIIALTIAFLFVYEVDRLNLQKAAVKKEGLGLILFITPVMTILTSLFSVGIGDYLVPYFKKKMKMSMRRSIATAVSFMFIFAAVSTISMNIIQDNIIWRIAAPAGLGVIIGGQLGPKINTLLSDNSLKELFTFSLLLIGIHLIYHAI